MQGSFSGSIVAHTPSLTSGNCLSVLHFYIILSFQEYAKVSFKGSVQLFKEKKYIWGHDCDIIS